MRSAATASGRRILGLYVRVWTTGEDGELLVPVGKAYFGFTDEELLQIDRFVRRNTIENSARREVCTSRSGLVWKSLRGPATLAAHNPRGDAVSPHQPLRWDSAARGRPAGTLERMLNPT